MRSRVGRGRGGVKGVEGFPPPPPPWGDGRGALIVVGVLSGPTARFFVRSERKKNIRANNGHESGERIVVTRRPCAFLHRRASAPIALPGRPCFASRGGPPATVQGAGMWRSVPQRAIWGQVSVWAEPFRPRFAVSHRTPDATEAHERSPAGQPATIAEARRWHLTKSGGGRGGLGG